MRPPVHLPFLRGLALLVSSAGLVGCGGAGWPPVLDPGDIAALRDVAPRIRRVRDLGQVHIGRGGPLLAEADGMFTIGELLLIEGHGFGKQPTVTLGGRPLEVLWRTEGGGVIGRMPTGVAAGPAVLVLRNAGGQDTATLPVRRLALVLDGERGQLHRLELSGSADQPPGLKALGRPLLVPLGKRVVLSSDGAAAYVLLPASPRAPDGPAQIAVFDLGAPGGPKRFDQRSLGASAHLLASAERAGVLVAVGRERLTLFDTRDARRAASWGSVVLPTEAKNPAAAALSPDGTLLALALADENRVLLLDIRPRADGPHPLVVAQVDLLPEARQPLLCDLRFATDGAAIWVLSGDNDRGRARGHQPTRLVTVQLDRAGEALALKQASVVDLPDAGAPLRLSVAQAQPLAAGTTIRDAPERAAVYLTAANAEGGALWRATGEAAIIYASAEHMGGVDLSPDGSLAVLVAEGAGGLSALVAHLRGGATLTVPLAGAAAARRPAGELLPEVVVQP